MNSYLIISKVITIVIINKTDKPVIKIKSAMVSYFSLSLSLLLRKDKNDSRLLIIKETVATAVNSSIKDVCLSFKTCSEVNTIKQRPSRFDEVFKI